jgi:hypothetical protein
MVQHLAIVFRPKVAIGIDSAARVDSRSKVLESLEKRYLRVAMPAIGNCCCCC